MPELEWYVDALGAAVNAKPLLESPNTFVPIPNMDRCFTVTRILSGKTATRPPILRKKKKIDISGRNGTLARAV